MLNPEMIKKNWHLESEPFDGSIERFFVPLFILVRDLLNRFDQPCQQNKNIESAYKHYQQDHRDKKCVHGMLSLLRLQLGGYVDTNQPEIVECVMNPTRLQLTCYHDPIPILDFLDTNRGLQGSIIFYHRVIPNV